MKLKLDIRGNEYRYALVLCDGRFPSELVTIMAWQVLMQAADAGRAYVMHGLYEKIWPAIQDAARHFTTRCAAAVKLALQEHKQRG